MMKRDLKLRKGFTLIETLTYMFCASILLMLATQLIHTSLQISTEARSHWQQDATLARMTRDLRRDMTHSLSFSYDEESTSLTVKLEDDRVVRWTFNSVKEDSENCVTQRVEVYPNEKESTEAYILTRGIRVGLVHASDSSGVRLRVTSQRPRPEEDGIDSEDKGSTEHIKLLRIIDGTLHSDPTPVNTTRLDPSATSNSVDSLSETQE